MNFWQDVSRDETLKKLSDSRIWAMIRKKYGANWEPEDLEEGDPLRVEFLYRIAQGR